MSRRIIAWSLSLMSFLPLLSGRAAARELGRPDTDDRSVVHQEPAAVPEVQVISPKGGETLKMGQNVVVEWTSKTPGTDVVILRSDLGMRGWICFSCINRTAWKVGQVQTPAAQGFNTASFGPGRYRIEIYHGTYNDEPGRLPAGVSGEFSIVD